MRTLCLCMLAILAFAGDGSAAGKRARPNPNLRTAVVTTPNRDVVPAPDPDFVPPSQGASTGPIVNPGAVLDISVYASGKKELDFTSTIAPDSTIMLPLAGLTRVAGLDATALSQRLQRIYERNYFVHPQVLVNVKEYGGRVVVSGEVRQPGIYPLGLGLTALSATVLAGGFTDFASTGKAKIVRNLRNGRTEVVKVDLGRILKGEIPDLALRDGDRVDVPRRLF